MVALTGLCLVGCAPQREQMIGGGIQGISRPDIVMANMTNLLKQAGYRTSTILTNNVFQVVFTKRCVNGKLYIDWNTFKPALNGDLIDHSVGFKVDISATWLAPSNALDTAYGIIDRAFELSKGDLYEISRGLQ